MSTKCLTLMAAVMINTIFGCGGPPAKVTPKETPEMKADREKAHDQVKARLEAEKGTSTSSPAK